MKPGQRSFLKITSGTPQRRAVINEEIPTSVLGPRFSCFADTFLAMKVFDQGVAVSMTHSPDIIG